MSITTTTTTTVIMPTLHTSSRHIGSSISGAVFLHQTADQTNAAAAVAGALEFGAGVSTKSSFGIHSVMAIAVIVASSSVAT